MSDTPRTDALIAEADATPECRVTFLIRRLANLAKELERENIAFKSARLWYWSHEKQEMLPIPPAVL